MIDAGLRPQAVRIDSGDLAAASRAVRATLDAAGLASTRIIVSGDLDEWKIADLIAASAPIDTFAVGTALATSDDAPALGGVYKLVQLEENGRVRQVMKRSEGKGTWPGVKQVWRSAAGGVAGGDTVALVDEAPLPDAIALLEPVMRDGRRLQTRALDDTRPYCQAMIGALPAAFRQLNTDATYPVSRSTRLDTVSR